MVRSSKSSMRSWQVIFNQEPYQHSRFRCTVYSLFWKRGGETRKQTNMKTKINNGEKSCKKLETWVNMWHVDFRCVLPRNLWLKNNLEIPCKKTMLLTARSPQGSSHDSLLLFKVNSRLVPIGRLNFYRLFFGRLNKQTATLPETNMAPENRYLEKEIPIGNHHLEVPC